MAVSTTSSNNSTTAIDVAGIVASLMKAENAPLDAVKAKIATKSTQISDLGVIKSKVASFQSALDGLETVGNYATVAASTSDLDVISATGTTGGVYGNYVVSNIDLAKSTVNAYQSASGTDFTSATDTVPLLNGKIGVADGSGTTYYVYGGLTGLETTTSNGSTYTSLKTNSFTASSYTAGTYTGVLISGTNGGGSYGTLVVNASGQFTVAITSVGSGFKDGDALTISGTSIGGTGSDNVSLGTLKVPSDGLQIDLTELASSINSLGINVSASVTKTISSTSYIFSIRGTQTGVDYGVTVGSFGSLTSSADAFKGSGTIAKNSSISVSATDASFTLDGIDYSRSSNTVSDVIQGVAFTLKKADTTSNYSISVSEGADNSSINIQNLISSYNDLISTYKTMVANSHNSTTGKTGTFAGNQTILYFINEIKARFSGGFSYGTSFASSLSLSSIGIDLAKDGAATFNAINFATAQADGLQSILADGVKMGYSSSTNYLNKYIDGLIGITGSTGLLADTLTNEQSALSALSDKQVTLEDRLAKIQNNYITQYSALNTLLYQLSVTSNALTSALSSLTSNQNN